MNYQVSRDEKFPAYFLLTVLGLLVSPLMNEETSTALGTGAQFLKGPAE